jgi:hypothetical protein
MILWSILAGLSTALAVALSQIWHWRWAPAVLLAAQVPWAGVNVLADAPGLWISWAALTLVGLVGLARALRPRPGNGDLMTRREAVAGSQRAWREMIRKLRTPCPGAKP